MSEALEELKKRVLSDVSGLENWEVIIRGYAVHLDLHDPDIGYFNPFNKEDSPSYIYSYSQDDKKWETCLHWKTDLRSSKYKTTNGVIKRIQLVVNKANGMLAHNRARHKKNAEGVALLTEKLNPYIKEYGDIFEILGPSNVSLKYAGFIGAVDLEKEAVDFSGNNCGTNWVPLHMAIPFIREVELYRLLE